jgi:hypothetical protein
MRERAAASLRLLFAYSDTPPAAALGLAARVGCARRGGPGRRPGADGAPRAQVVELGQVGRVAAAAGGGRALYLHHQRGPGWGDAAPLVAAFRAAAAGAPGAQVTAARRRPAPRRPHCAAAAAARPRASGRARRGRGRAAGRAQARVEEASAGNPGIPPSSLMAFLRARPAVAGVVVADHDGSFSTPYYHSRFDNASTIDEESIAAAAVTTARVLHALASGAGAPALQVCGPRAAPRRSGACHCALRRRPERARAPGARRWTARPCGARSARWRSACCAASPGWRARWRAP